MNPFETLPALAGLRLGGADLALLQRQGFVCEERRGDRVVYKLRFRNGNGRQVVRFIGAADVAKDVRSELGRLQSRRDSQRELAALGGDARDVLRNAKAVLQPLLMERGYYYHGQAVRRRRPTKTS